ncbi:uncharacterized protein LOC127576492 [Pristis pectinata]|uniref:uncharacterized protein LOC127576492 n=1 Tax=Pristis pectinata TaxID=685728 RepID=UPI00223DBA57|nr:uncharacterized protein LOC127576492 [Pristis pectinata]
MGVAPYLCLLLSCLAGVRSDVVLTQPASAVVKPGASHRLTCEVSGFDLSSYYMHWVKQVSGRGLEWLVQYYSESSNNYAPGVQDRFTASKDRSNFYLQMNDLRLDDTATYYCARDIAGRGYGARRWGAEHKLVPTSERLQRSLSPATPHCCFPESLSTQDAEDIVGRMVLAVAGSSKGNHQCSATYTGVSPGPPQTHCTPEFTERQMPPGLSPHSTTWSQVLLDFPGLHWGIHLNDSLPGRTWQRITVPIHVTGDSRPPKLIPVVPSPEVLHSQTTAVLGCAISGFYPDNIKVSWEKAGSTRAGIVLASTSTTDGGFQTVTYLTVPVQEWISKQEYTCEVTHTPSGFREKVNMRYQEELSVFIQNPSTEEIWINKTATLVCMVVGADLSQVQIYWQVSKREKIKGDVTKKLREEGTQDTVISQLQTSVEEWSSGVEYMCSAQQPSSSSAVSARTKSTKVETKSPKVRLLPPPHEGTKSRNMATLECVVSGFYPDHISVTWEKDGSLISSNTSATPTALEQGGTFSASHFLTVSTEEWKKGSVFSCTVSHPPSNTRVSQEVKSIQELSVFIQNPSTEEIWINKTATLVCMVVGADLSQVQIYWQVSEREKIKGDVTKKLREEGTQDTVISQLQTSVEEWSSGVEYVCSAQQPSSSSAVSARTKSTKVETKSPKVRLLPPPHEGTKSRNMATLECVVSGFYPDHISVTWEKDGSLISSNTSATPTALEQGGTFSASHFLTVSTEEWKKGSVFSCTVSHPPSNARVSQKVKIIQELSVFIQNPGIEEMWLNNTAVLKCTIICTDPSKVHISWEVSGKDRTKEAVTRPPEREGIRNTVISELQTSVEEWFSGVEYVCSAQRPSSPSAVSARTKSTKVETKGPEVRLLPPPQEETKNRSTATLECVVSGFYPDRVSVTWEKGNSLITSNTSATLTALEQGGTFSASYFLTVSLQEWKSDSVFSCTVTHPPSNTRIKKQVKNIQDECSDTRPSVTLSKPSFEEIWTNRTATILCKVVHTDLQGFRVTWQVDGRRREDGVRTQGPHSDRGEDTITSRLTVPAAEWDSGAEYLCRVEDKSLPTPEKRSIKKDTGGVVTHPHIYLLPPSSDEVETDQTVTLMCLVTNFSPAEIYVAWMANDTLLKTGFVNQPVTKDTRNGWNTMTSQLKVSPKDWNSGTTFSCVVGHESITTSLFRSINKSHSKPSLVNLSLVLTDSFKSCV